MLLSIDPGINNTGLSIIEFKDNLYVHETVLVSTVRKFTDEEKEVEKFYNSKTVKVLAILKKIEEILEKYQLNTIAIEAPFYNALTPVAYGSILEVIFALKYAIVVPRKMKLHLIEPLLVKKLFAREHLATKAIMRELLTRKVDEKEIVLNKSIENLSEHEVDSIAVGYAYFLTLKEKELGRD